MKRRIRYLSGAKRFVYHFDFDDASTSEPLTICGYCLAGRYINRRSTSGGAACRRSHLIKHQSTTQPTVALRSAEAELTRISKGAARGFGLQPLGKEFDINVSPRTMSKATAAMGISRRRGLGKVMDLATADLWIQDRIRKAIPQLIKSWALVIRVTCLPNMFLDIGF